MMRIRELLELRDELTDLVARAAGTGGEEGRYCRLVEGSHGAAGG